MKHKIIFFFLALAAMIGLATAQSSQGRSLSGSKSGADPATKPLSPKSAMPAQHKSSVPAPVVPSATGSTTSELNQLEHQNPHASSSTKGTARTKSAPAPKPAAQPKSTETSTAKGSGVDFKYQKPKGGMQAETLDPNSANRPNQRVKKKK
jgi:hypothetical protein